MKYTEMKEFLEKHPHCFQPLEEKTKEFDQKVADIERKPIIFTEHSEN